MNDDSPKLITDVHVMCPAWQVYSSVFGTMRHWIMQLTPSEIAFNALTYSASTA